MSAVKTDPDGENGNQEPLAKRIRTEGVRRHHYTVAKQRVVQDPEEQEGFTHEKLVDILTKAVHIWDKLSPMYSNDTKYDFVRHHLYKMYLKRFSLLSVTKLTNCHEPHSEAKGFKLVDKTATIAALQDIFDTAFPEQKNYTQLRLHAGQAVLRDVFEKVRDSILVDISS
jgi:hypothetical protein